MSKLVRRWGSVLHTAVIASTDKTAHAMFGNLTLNQIAEKFDLDESDAEWYDGTNSNTGERITSAIITVKGVKYQIPTSRGFTPEMRNSYEMLPNCMVRITEKSVKVKGADGKDTSEQKKDANGKPILTKIAYMSLGKPQGVPLVDEQLSKMFEGAPELVEEDDDQA